MRISKRIIFLVNLIIFVSVFFLLDRGLSVLLLNGLEKYFGLNEPVPILFIGNSHTVLGINKQLVESTLKERVGIYAREGADIMDREIMLRQYFSRFPLSRPVVIYDVNARIFAPSGLSENSYLLFYPFCDEPVVSSYIDGFIHNKDELIRRQLFKMTRYNDITLRFALRGWLGMWKNLKSSHINPNDFTSEDIALRYSRIKIDEKQLSQFYNTIDYCDSLGIKLVLLYYPSISTMTSTDTSAFNSCIKLFENCCQSNKTVKFINYNNLFPDDCLYFFDPIHLNSKGQEVFTRRLISDIKAQLP